MILLGMFKGGRKGADMYQVAFRTIQGQAKGAISSHKKFYRSYNFSQQGWG